MAAPQFSADAILAEIRLRAKLPEDDETWSDANLLSVLNSELQSWGAPFLMAARAEFLNFFRDYTTNINQTAYGIPGQAVGGVIRNIQALDSSGNVWPIQQIDIQDLSPFSAFSAGTPTAFYVRGDSIVLTSAASGQWTLRFYYARRPSEVVLVAAAAQITAISSNTITCAGGFPAGFVAGSSMDFVHGESSFLPFIGTFTMPTPGMGNTAVFSSVPTGLAVGDWLCLAGQSPFPQVPADIQPVLQQRVVAVALRAEGDDKAAVEWKAFLEMENNARNLIQPRVQGNLKGLRGTLNRFGGTFPGLGRW